jgi:hypothetical protein
MVQAATRGVAQRIGNCPAAAQAAITAQGEAPLSRLAKLNELIIGAVTEKRHGVMMPPKMQVALG